MYFACDILKWYMFKPATGENAYLHVYFKKLQDYCWDQNNWTSVNNYLAMFSRK